MIQITPQTRILLHVKPLDFRKGIDGIAAFCREVLKQDPFSGSLFVFRNRAGSGIKALIYDGQGFWIFCKRFSKGRLRHWPKAADRSSDNLLCLAARELSVLIWNGNPVAASFAPQWRSIL